MPPERHSQTNSLRQWFGQASPRLLLQLFLLVAGTGAVLFFIAWLLWGDGLSLPIQLEQEMPAVAAEISEAASQPGLTEMVVDGINLGTVNQFSPPQQIEINGFTLPVSTQYVTREAIWQTADPAATQISWLENSIINYVFRLPANHGYRDILEQAVAQKSEIQLITTQGQTLAFTIEEGQTTTAVSDQTIQQKQPAITLLWLDPNQQNSYVVSGTYLATTPTNPINITSAYLKNSATSDAATAVTIQIEGIDLQPDGQRIMVRAILTNAGLAVYTINNNQILLESDGLRSQILEANPPLPWQLPPDNTQIPVTLILQRPPAATAILTIGPQDYKVTNLR